MRITIIQLGNKEHGVSQEIVDNFAKQMQEAIDAKTDDVLVTNNPVTVHRIDFDF